MMDISPYEFIKTKITQAFVDLAEELSQAQSVSEEDAGIPMGLFRAQEYMLAAWDRFTTPPPGEDH